MVGQTQEFPAYKPPLEMTPILLSRIDYIYQVNNQIENESL